jgi:uncharacterized membrane protein
MTRGLFITRLRQGLTGLPEEEINEIVTDYQAHFSDALAAGRSETDVAASLGDPLKLGQELKTEARLRRWETSRNPRTFISASAALMPAFTLAVLIPVIGALIACAAVAAYVLYVAAGTGLRLAAGLTSGGVLVPSLIGIGLIFGVVGIGTLIALALDSGLRLLGRHVRLNYQLLRMPVAGGGDED